MKKGNKSTLKKEMVTILIITQCVEDFKIKINQFVELFTPMGVWVVNSDQMNIEPPNLSLTADDP